MGDFFMDFINIHKIEIRNFFFSVCNRVTSVNIYALTLVISGSGCFVFICKTPWLILSLEKRHFFITLYQQAVINSANSYMQFLCILLVVMLTL